MPEASGARNDYADLLAQAEEAEDSGDFKGALENWRAALALTPESIKLRCYIGRLLMGEGRHAEAEALIREGLELRPESISLSRDLAEVLAGQGAYPAAIDQARELVWPLRKDDAFREAYAAWLARAGEKDAAALSRLAALWNELAEMEKSIEAERALLRGEAMVAPDESHVRALFDCYAEEFDEHLATLGYNAPDILRDAVDQALSNLVSLDILDLGCGSGMSGAAFKPLARRLVGVDLSPRMLKRAARRKIYDQLTEGDLVEALRAPQRLADVIVAADALPYIGDLAELLALAAKALRHGGCLAATVEKAETGDFVLQKTQRYAHGENYIRRLAAGLPFEVASMDEIPLRRERDGVVRALIFVLRKKV